MGRKVFFLKDYRRTGISNQGSVVKNLTAFLPAFVSQPSHAPHDNERAHLKLDSLKMRELAAGF